MQREYLRFPLDSKLAAGGNVRVEKAIFQPAIVQRRNTILLEP